MFAEDGLESIRKVVKDLEERLKVGSYSDGCGVTLMCRARLKLPGQNGKHLP